MSFSKGRILWTGLVLLAAIGLVQRSVASVAITLVTLAVIVACPLMMAFMMRGGHGRKDRSHEMSGNGDAADRRLADLEREVAELRGAQNERRVTDSRPQ